MLNYHQVPTFLEFGCRSREFLIVVFDVFTRTCWQLIGIYGILLHAASNGNHLKCQYEQISLGPVRNDCCSQRCNTVWFLSETAAQRSWLRLSSMEKNFLRFTLYPPILFFKNVVFLSCWCM